MNNPGAAGPVRHRYASFGVARISVDDMEPMALLGRLVIGIRKGAE